MAGKKDIVEQALKLIAGKSKEVGPKALRGKNTPTNAWHATEKPFTSYDWGLLGSATKPNVEGTSAENWAMDLARVGPWSSEKKIDLGFGTQMPVTVSGKGKAFNSLDDLQRAIAKAGGPDKFRQNMTAKGFGHLRVADEEFGGTSYVSLTPETFTVRDDPIDRASGGSIRQGYGPGGWVDDVVKMAGKVMGEGDNVTRLSDVRSARETDALIKKIKSAVNLVKSGHFQAGRQALINQKSLDLHKSGMLPLQQGTIVTPPSTWDMPGDWRVSGYWYDEKDPRRFGYKLQNESGQTYDAAASDPRAGLRRDNPYSFGAGFKAYAGPNASPPKPVAPPVEKPATPKPPEVLDAINKEYEDLFGSEDPFKPRAHGGRIAKGPGGWLDDVVKMAGKVISGEGDDAAKAGIKAYRGTPQPTENLIDLFHGTTPEAFDAITSSGDIFGSSRFSPRRDVAETFAHNVGGDDNTVVKVKAPASSLMIDLDLPNAKLLTPDEAAAYLDKPDWTILDFIENGYSVGVPDTSVLSIDRAAGGRAGSFGNNSISGALNVARGLNGGE